MITYLGDWRPDDRAAVEDAVAAVSAKLDFDAVFGDIIFAIGKYLSYDGYTSGNVIKIKPGKGTPRLVVHELGHRLSTKLGNAPLKQLSRYGIQMVGKLLTGPGVGGYQRHGGRYAPANGYKSDRLPDQYHPRNWRNGNTASEDWADLFLNWVYRSFAPGSVGDALYAWVDEQIGALISRQ